MTQNTMAERLYTMLSHIDGEGFSATFEGEDGGERAMRLAMDLERQDYVVRVYKQVVGKTITDETIYQSDDWVPPGKAK